MTEFPIHRLLSNDASSRPSALSLLDNYFPTEAAALRNRIDRQQVGTMVGPRVYYETFLQNEEETMNVGMQRQQCFLQEANGVVCSPFARSAFSLHANCGPARTTEV